MYPWRHWHVTFWSAAVNSQLALWWHGVRCNWTGEPSRSHRTDGQAPTLLAHSFSTTQTDRQTDRQTADWQNSLRRPRTGRNRLSKQISVFVRGARKQWITKYYSLWLSIKQKQTCRDLKLVKLPLSLSSAGSLFQSHGLATCPRAGSWFTARHVGVAVDRSWWCTIGKSWPCK